MNNAEIVARAEALIGKMLASGQHIGKSFDIPALEAIVAAGLPAELTINGRRARVGGQTVDLLDEAGKVVKTQPLTDAVRESLLVSHAVAACQRSRHMGG